MSPPRYRSKGLTSSPSISTTVRIFDTWHPEDGYTDLYKVADHPDWSVLDRDASVMTDFVSDTGANASGDYTMARPTTHYTVGRVNVQPATVHSTVGQYEIDTLIDPVGAPLGNGAFANDFVCPDPPVEVVSQFAIQCLDEMASMFPPEQDFLSFVLELKSLVGVIDNLADIAAFIEDLSVYNHVSIRRAAKIHAGYNFGVSPIVDDFSTLFSTIKRVKRRIEWLLRNSGKWVRVGSQKSYEIEEEMNWGMGFGYAGWSPGCSVTRVRQVGKLHATARVMQVMPNVSSWLMFVKGIILDMGLNRPFTTIWEQTPFSWAVDYFIPVGEYLKKAQHFADPNWVVRDPSWSFKTYYDFRMVTSNHDGEPKQIGDFQLAAYRRRVGLPEWEFYEKTPSLKQWSLLAAVAVQED